MPQWTWPTLGLCMALPWLNPFAPGPSPAVDPWLLAMACSGLMLLLLPPARPRAASIAVLLGVMVLLWLPRVAGGQGIDTERLGATMAMMAMVACALAGAAAQPREAVLRAMAWSWLAAALQSAIVGLCQYFDAAHWFAPWMNISVIGEAFANLRQRNQFATLTSIGLLALVRLLDERLTLRMAVVPALLLAAGNAASASRIGLLQLLAIAVAMALWRSPRRRERVALAALALIGYALAGGLLPLLAAQLGGQVGGSVAQRLAQDEGCSSRLVLWSNVLELIRAQPVLGWGWGELDYAHYMTLYPGERFCDILDNAHNLPLHLAVELGVPALFLLGAAAVWWLLRLPVPPWRERDATRQMAWGMNGVILLHSLVEYPLWYGPFETAFGLCCGLLLRGPVAAALADGQVRLLAQRCWRWVPGALLVGASLYGALQYRSASQIYLPPQQREPAARSDTLAKAKEAWPFLNQALFAELTTQPLTRANAARQYALAAGLLHYSPEPRVIEKLIESAVMLGHDGEAVLHTARYRAAFPADYERWRARPEQPVQQAGLIR